MRVYSRSYWLAFFVQPIVLAKERWQTFENSWEKNTIFNEHPVQMKESIVAIGDDYLIYGCVALYQIEILNIERRLYILMLFC